MLNLSRGVLRRWRRERNHRPEPPAAVEFTPADPMMLAAIHRLPVRQRDCVLLRFYVELSALDIARTLGLAPGTVKNHLHRALTTLSSTLEPQP
ncbi:MAG: RNA polymerase sigma factor [Acidimicrobiales bacterium]